MRKPSLLSRALLATLFAGLCASPARSVAIDSFEDGTFAFSHDQSASRQEQQHGSMLGGARIVSLSTARRMTTLSASVAEGSSRLSFDTGTGPMGPLGAGTITLTYGSGFFDLPQDPLGIDLSGFDRFLIEVLELQGRGEVSRGR